MDEATRKDVEATVARSLKQHLDGHDGLDTGALSKVAGMDVSGRLTDDTTHQAFQALRDHLRDRGDVTNRALKDIAGFDRDTLANWYMTAANDKGDSLRFAEAQELIYGMPYDEWRETVRGDRHAPEEEAALKGKNAVWGGGGQPL